MNLPKKAEGVEFMESGEMPTYVGSKNYCWIWIAGDRLGKRFVSFVSVDRSTETGFAIWEEIKDIPVLFYCSDYWKSYEAFLLEEKHLQTKAETFTVEGYNSRIRHYLTRFKRKKKCYSKDQHMIDKSLKLVFLKLNNELPILI